MMSELYRGVPVPDVESNGNVYAALDDFGLFCSMDKKNVLTFWRAKVDTVLKWRLIDEGLFCELPNDQVGCTRCGAVVFDVFLHSHA